MKLSEQCIAVEQAQKLADLGVAQIISTWQGTKTAYSSYALHVSNDGINWDTRSCIELDTLQSLTGIDYLYKLCAFSCAEIIDIITRLRYQETPNLHRKDRDSPRIIITNTLEGYRSYGATQFGASQMAKSVRSKRLPESLCDVLFKLISEDKDWYKIVDTTSTQQINETILSWHTVDGLDKPTIIK